MTRNPSPAPQVGALASAILRGSMPRPTLTGLSGWGEEAARRLPLDVRAEVRAFLGTRRLSPAQAAEVDRVAATVARRELAVSSTSRSAEERLVARTVAAALAALRSCGYRAASSSWAGGETTYRVGVGYPGARGDSSRVWSKNGKWSGSNAAYTASVDRSWLRLVARPGLATLDGLFTLRAEPVAGALPAGVTRAWTATWARQGRGFDLVVEAGVIVEGADGTRLHAKSLAHSATLLRRRTPAPSAGASAEARAKREAAREAKLSARCASLAAWSAAELAAPVTLDDSERAGNCPAGSADFAERHFEGRSTASVRDVMAVAIESGDRVRLAAVRRMRRG